MSDPKRATLITVGAHKSAKSNVNKTVRLTVLLEESTNCKYPELNYKELVIAEEKKKHVQNGKNTGLDPFSDNDDDVERVARKFEQKYGGKSTYGKKGRSKQDDFADIGAGYDENDSFIDNTHGYDEMIPPECDTIHGGFYINSGSLEFKSVPLEQSSNSGEIGGKRVKRRLSSSSSEEDSSQSSSESSQDESNPKAIANGSVDTHNTEHRKKKNKKADKTKAKKVRRTDSSAATSGKQTSDDNGHADAESVDCADSRTSHSDSAASKPAPSSENAVTSDSSRDADAKVDSKLPESVTKALTALAASVGNQTAAQPSTTPKQLLAAHETHLLRLEEAVSASGGDACVSRAAWARAAQALHVPRARLLQRVRARKPNHVSETASDDVTAAKRKLEEEAEDCTSISEEQREALIVDTLQRLKDLIEERKPSMLANYTAECKRVLEERKKLKMAETVAGAPHIEKRLPKRRFPWCGRARSLLARLAALGRTHHDAAALLARRALPLFPNGFARMPTLLRQADLSKEIKVSDLKRQRLGSASQPTSAHTQPPPAAEPIQFPSSLTVTTMLKTSPEKSEPQETDEKYKSASIFGTILNSYSVNKEFKVEDKPEDLYVPPNNIGSITITPVPNQKEKKADKPCGLIRVKSPAALNDMVNKKDSKPIKKVEKQSNSKRVESPLHIDTSYQPSKKDPSPKHSDGMQSSKKEPSPKGKDEVTQKQIECMRVAENNIPRPALVPVHHSPTFAKPDKRPPEVKKKKDLIVVSDVDPLSDVPESLNIDDSSSDVEVIETDKSDSLVPSKDKKKSVKSVPKVKDGRVDEDAADDTDIDILLRNIREMERRTNSSEQNGWS